MSFLKENKKNLIFATIIFILSIIIAIIFYDRLPVRIPIHYDLYADSNFYTNKTNALLFVITFMILLYLALFLIISLDPKSDKHDKNYKHIFLLFIPILNFLIVSLTVWKTFNDNIDVGRILLGLFSLLVAISGIFMPKIKRNYTMGFRTSWAMEDDFVWKKTQKFAGILFFFSGIISLTSLSFSLNICFYIFIASLIISTLFSFIYSYYIYRKIKK